MAQRARNEPTSLKKSLKSFIKDESGSITKQAGITLGAMALGGALSGSVSATHECGPVNSGDYGGDGGGGGGSSGQGGTGGTAYDGEATMSETFGPGWSPSNEGATYDGGGGGGGGGGCFLTSAACAVLGKSDDCEELQALRALRDRVMQGSDAGRDLIAQYYKLAPGVAARFLEHPLRNEIAKQMFAQFLPNVMGALKSEKPDEAIAVYREMALYVKGRIDGANVGAI